MYMHVCYLYHRPRWTLTSRHGLITEDRAVHLIPGNLVKVHLHVHILNTVHSFSICTCIISYRDKANASNDTRRQLFFFQRKRRAASGGTRTRNLLRSRQMLYHCTCTCTMYTYRNIVWSFGWDVIRVCQFVASSIRSERVTLYPILLHIL